MPERQTETKTLLANLATQLQELGVTHYVIMAVDPDGNQDVYECGGSTAWQLGICQSVVTRIDESYRDEGEY